MRSRDSLTTGQIAGWGTLGFVAGLVMGTALSAWAGGVSRERLGRAARRLRAAGPPGARTAASAARDAEAALSANPALAGLGLEVAPIAARSVELRGWVETRALRAVAARTARSVDGIDVVVNSILVRGEDDRQHAAPAPRPA